MKHLDHCPANPLIAECICVDDDVMPEETRASDIATRFSVDANKFARIAELMAVLRTEIQRQYAGALPMVTQEELIRLDQRASDLDRDLRAMIERFNRRTLSR